jgi:GntR family transcriptional regulator
MGLPVQVDKESGIPLYVQIEQQIRLLIQQGALRPGELLPTVRSLAVQLEINANTVARVYRDLQRAGVLVLRRGIGTSVADTKQRTMTGPELKRLEAKVAEVIALCRRLGVDAGVLGQLIETKWRESA